MFARIFVTFESPSLPLPLLPKIISFNDTITQHLKYNYGCELWSFIEWNNSTVTKKFHFKQISRIEDGE